MSVLAHVVLNGPMPGALRAPVVFGGWIRSRILPDAELGGWRGTGVRRSDVARASCRASKRDGDGKSSAKLGPRRTALRGPQERSVSRQAPAPVAQRRPEAGNLHPHRTPRRLPHSAPRAITYPHARDNPWCLFSPMRDPVSCVNAPDRRASPDIMRKSPNRTTLRNDE